MKTMQYTLVILTLVLFGGCNFILQEEENKAWDAVRKSDKIEELISFAFNYPKAEKIDSCILKLDQLVKLNPEISLAIYPILDSLTGEIKFGFIDTNNDCSDYYIKKRNAYLITIKDKGAFHGNLKLNYENLIESIKYLLEIWQPKDEVPQNVLSDEIDDNTQLGISDDVDVQSKISGVKYFGTIVISKLIIVIDTDIYKFSFNSKMNWKHYIATLTMVNLAYQEIWNAKAQEVWEKDFSDLKLEKKLAIMKCIPFRMELNFTKRIFRK